MVFPMLAQQLLYWIPLVPPPFHAIKGEAKAASCAYGGVELLVLARNIDPLNWTPFPLPPPLSFRTPCPMTRISPLKFDCPVILSAPVTTSTPEPVLLPKLKSPFTYVICGAASVP